jgi:hypothetical protein
VFKDKVLSFGSSELDEEEGEKGILEINSCREKRSSIEGRSVNHAFKRLIVA